MSIASTRDTIIASIRKAKGSRLATELAVPDISSAIYKPIQGSPLDCFKNELETVAGLCTVCSDEQDLFQKLRVFLQESDVNEIYCRDEAIASQLALVGISNTSATVGFLSMNAAITNCEFLIARTGTVVISSVGESGRQLNFYPPIHIVIAHKSQIVDFPTDAIQALEEKYTTDNLPSLISFVSGPSRTADIEKTLVLGAHGPKTLHVFIYE